MMRISVICPVYNTAPTLLQAAAQSVIATTGVHLHELILVDDVSTRAETLDTIREIAAGDPRVVVVRSPRNGGQACARNLGIRTATGDWIGFTDHDDLWLPGRVEAMLAVVENYPEARWVNGNYVCLMPGDRYEPAKLISAECAGERLGESLVRLAAPELTRCLLANAWLHLGGSLIRREVLAEVGSFYDGYYFHEDCIIFVKLSVAADLYFVEQEWYSWRRNMDSQMTSPARLTDMYAVGWRWARADALLRPFRRELRWTLYATYKGIAINNLRNGHRGRGLGFALRALLLDPREIGQFLRFLRLLLRDRGRLGDEEWKYSGAERFTVGARDVRA